jgi:hypothetical protein
MKLTVTHRAIKIPKKRLVKSLRFLAEQERGGVELGVAI